MVVSWSSVKEKDDIVQEFTNYLSKAKKETPDSRPTLEKAKQLWISNKHDDLFVFFLSQVKVLLGCPINESEAIFNLLVELMRLTNMQDKHLKGLVDAVANSSKGSFQVSIKVLLNIYHSVPEESAMKPTLYEAIIRVCMDNFYPKVLSQHLESLPDWMISWKLSTEGKKRIYKLLAESFRKDALLEQEELHSLTQYLKLSPMADPEASEKLDRAVSLALNNSTILKQFEELTGACTWIPTSISKVIASIKAGDVKAIANSSLKSEYESNGFTKKYGPFEVVERKTRVIGLLRLALSFLNKELLYSEVAEKLSIPEEVVEETVIEAVRSGYLTAQMDQLKKSVFFQNVAYFSGMELLKEDLWKQLKEKIHGQQEKVRSLQKLVSNVSKNHQIGKVSNTQ